MDQSIDRSTNRQIDRLTDRQIDRYMTLVCLVLAMMVDPLDGYHRCLGPLCAHVLTRQAKDIDLGIYEDAWGPVPCTGAVSVGERQGIRHDEMPLKLVKPRRTCR